LLTFEVVLPAPGPRKVVLELLLVTIFEYAFPAPIPTYTLHRASPMDAKKDETLFAETVSILTSSRLVL
jgi:hypothetical protein